MKKPRVTDLFVWAYDENHCELGLLQNFEAYEVPIKSATSEALSILMASDSSLIRVTKTAPLSKCGRVLFSTNFPFLYVYPTSRPDQFSEKIHPSEVKIQTYVDNQDDFLYHHLTDQLEDQLQDVLAATCHQRSFFRSSSFYLAREHPEFISFKYRNGTFAHANGEVLYLYDCAPVLLQPVEMAQCFEQLPVRNLNATAKDARPLFLEPLTRRITHADVPTPCSPQFPPKYRTISGQWIAATPQLTSSSTPQTLAIATQAPAIEFEDTDFSAGGIYTDETWQAVEEFLEFRGMKQSLGAQLTQQTSSGYVGHYVTPSQLFAETTSLEWTSLAWSWFKSTVYQIGQVMTYVMGVATILKFISYLVHVCTNFSAVRRQFRGNPLMAIFWAFNPISFLLQVFNRRPQPDAPPAEEDTPQPVRQDRQPQANFPRPPRPQALQMEPIRTAPVAPAAPSTPASPNPGRNTIVPLVPDLPAPLQPIRR